MKPATLSSLSVSVLATSVAFAASDGGIGALRARLGAACPTGAFIGAVQVEAPMTGGGSDYAPDRALSEFSGKSVALVDAPFATSWHATNVAQRLFGATSAMATRMNDAWVHNVNNWINSPLRVGTGTAVATGTDAMVRVMNHSWIGSFGAGNEAYDREAVRRLDFMMSRDGILAVCGENNGAGSARYPLMGDCFNGISVGRSDLQHSAGLTGAQSDVPGRTKPEIIAPGTYTSFATPVVGSASALIFEVLNNGPFSTLGNSQKAQVAKVCLLGGADRPTEWSNNAPATGSKRGVATQPMNAIRGCGELNVDASHRIASSIRVDGASGPTLALPVAPAGWGIVPLAAGGNASWRFRLYQPVPQLDVTLTWPRTTTSTGSGSSFANLDLRLRRSLSGGATLLALDGDAGVGMFESGNVTSASVVDNVEVLHLLNLQAGEYTLEVSRVDAGTFAATGYVSWIAPVPDFGIEGDVDGNRQVDFGDVAFALMSYGFDDPLADVDANGTVDLGDIAIILLNYG